MSRAARSLAALSLALLCAGCGTPRLDALEAQVAELRVELRAVRAEVLEQAEAERAPLGPGVPPAGRDELEALRAQVALLEARLAELAANRDAPAPAVEPTLREPRVVIPNPGSRDAPEAGATVEVLSVGSGDLFLARVGGELERLRLAGIEAPSRVEEYESEPSRRARHAVAFGEASTQSDAAWRASREFLFERIKGKSFVLRYAGGRARRSLDGSLPVVLQEEEAVINAEVVAAGWALARDATYRSQEERAREKKRGLFAGR